MWCARVEGQHIKQRQLALVMHSVLLLQGEGEGGFHEDNAAQGDSS